MELELADDILRGVKRISAFINEDTRSTYHKLSTGSLPGGKEGNQWIASKSALREHYARITSGKVA
jgi:hypothetical protein